MSKSKVLFIMTGSIACYKACNVISKLTQNNFEVQVVATKSALEFVGNSTLEGLSGKPAIHDMYAAGNVMDHIHLMRWADLVVVAPATANFINKAASGIADDLVSTLFMAHDFKKPLLIAPAMNTSMFNHPITQASLKKLSDMGIQVLESTSGMLACGESGSGRLLEPEIIFEKIQTALPMHQPNDSKSVATKSAAKILITAGGTQEPIDTVRVISNISSGKTGLKLAQAFKNLGCDVTLLRAHNTSAIDSDIEQKIFTDFESLQSQMQHELAQHHYTHIIHLAAVSDYSVESINVNNQNYKKLDIPKLNSDAETMQINLRKNPKIVNALKTYSLNKNVKLIAFKLTSRATAEQREQAVSKLQAASHADLVVHNDLSEIDIVNKTHQFTIYEQKQTIACHGIESLINQLSLKILPEVLL